MTKYVDGGEDSRSRRHVLQVAQQELNDVVFGVLDELMRGQALDPMRPPCRPDEEEESARKRFPRAVKALDDHAVTKEPVPCVGQSTNPISARRRRDPRGNLAAQVHAARASAPWPANDRAPASSFGQTRLTMREPEIGRASCRERV